MKRNGDCPCLRRNNSLNPLTTIVQKSILPLRDRNRAYMHGFQRIRSNVFLIKKFLNYIIR